MFKFFSWMSKFGFDVNNHLTNEISLQTGSSTLPDQVRLLKIQYIYISDSIKLCVCFFGFFCCSTYMKQFNCPHLYRMFKLSFPIICIVVLSLNVLLQAAARREMGCAPLPLRVTTLPPPPPSPRPAPCQLDYCHLVSTRIHFDIFIVYF